MGKGRKKLPAEIVKLRGTDRKDRARPEVSTGKALAEVQMWTVPGYELLSARGKQIYRKVARQANSLKILTPADLPALVIYAREYDYALKAMEEEDRVGVMYATMDKDGQIIWHSNPARMVVDSTIRNINKIGSNFGFSPVDRQKVAGIIKSGEESKGPKAVFERLLIQMDTVNDEPEEQ